MSLYILEWSLCSSWQSCIHRDCLTLLVAGQWLPRTSCLIFFLSPVLKTVVMSGAWTGETCLWLGEILEPWGTKLLSTCLENGRCSMLCPFMSDILEEKRKVMHKIGISHKQLSMKHHKAMGTGRAAPNEAHSSSPYPLTNTWAFPSCCVFFSNEMSHNTIWYYTHDRNVHLPSWSVWTLPS